MKNSEIRRLLGGEDTEVKISLGGDRPQTIHAVAHCEDGSLVLMSAHHWFPSELDLAFETLSAATDGKKNWLSVMRHNKDNNWVCWEHGVVWKECPTCLDTVEVGYHFGSSMDNWNIPFCNHHCRKECSECPQSQPTSP